MYDDACLDASGGFLIVLKIWRHLELPDDLVKCTLGYLQDNRENNFISINVLEFMTVIIDYCIAYTS